MVNRNSINDYPITIHDVKHSHAIFSPDFAGVRGKTVRHKLENVTMYYFSIPREVLKLHKYVTVVYDVTFVNNILFLITMYWGIRFITVEHVPTCTANQLSKSLRRILCSYSCGSMVVQNILMDIEFEKPLINWCTRLRLIPLTINKQIEDIDRFILTLKDSIRAIVRTLTFQYLRNMIVANIFYLAVLWLNALPIEIECLSNPHH